MSASFNHTIIAAEDRAASAAFYRDMLEIEDAPSWGFFTNLRMENGVLLQFAEPPVPFFDPAGHAIELLTRPYV